jgi:hypothetical protein
VVSFEKTDDSEVYTASIIITTTTTTTLMMKTIPDYTGVYSRRLSLSC